MLRSRIRDRFFYFNIHRQYLFGLHDSCSKSSQTHRLRRRRQQPTEHLFSTSSAHGKSGDTSTTPWERGAKIVKDTDVSSPYLERVRSEVVDPALHIKTIEDELCGAIGKALGRQGAKVLFAIDQMKEAHAQYLECIRAQCYDKAVRYAHLHNDARKRAIQARWELLVHRQAVGFTVDNHSVVHKTFPITGALPTIMEDISSSGGRCEEAMQVNNSIEQHCTKKAWGDQLSWWESVGRWK